MPDGNSSVVKRRHGRSPVDSCRLFEIRGYRVCRIVEAERHIPGLAGKDQHDSWPAPGRCSTWGTAPPEPELTAGRNERIGMLCNTSSTGTITVAARLFVAAMWPLDQREEERE